MNLDAQTELKINYEDNYELRVLSETVLSKTFLFKTDCNIKCDTKKNSSIGSLLSNESDHPKFLTSRSMDE